VHLLLDWQSHQPAHQQRNEAAHSPPSITATAQCSFFEFRQYKIVHRRYASLFFMVGVDQEEVGGLRCACNGLGMATCVLVCACACVHVCFCVCVCAHMEIMSARASLCAPLFRWNLLLRSGGLLLLLWASL